MWRSQQTFRLFFDGTPGIDGRFSFLVQPIPGNFNTLDQYYISLYQPVVAGVGGVFYGDGAAYANPANYANAVGNMETRHARHYNQHLYPSIGYYRANPGDLTRPLGAPTLSAANTYVVPIDNTTVGVSIIQPPPGCFSVHASWYNAGLPIFNLQVTSSGVTRVNETNSQPGPFNWIDYDSIWVVDSQTATITFTWFDPGGRTQPTSGNITLTPCAPANNQAPIDFGDVGEMRPAAMSVLCTSLLPKGFTGGNIGSINLRSGTNTDVFFSENPSPDIGNFHLPDPIGQAGGYVGPAVDGTYAYWVAPDKDAYQFVKPSDLNAAELGGIVVSGQISSSGVAGITTGTPIYEVTIITDWECQTQNPLWNPVPRVGSQAEFDFMYSWMKTHPSEGSNDAHFPRLRRMYQNIAAWYENHKEALQPFMKAAPTAAAAVAKGILAAL